MEMEPAHSSIRNPLPEAPVNIDSLSLAELKTSLAQHESQSNAALEKASAKKEESEQLIARASRRDAQAQELRLHYEVGERVAQDIRNAIVLRNKQALEKTFQPGETTKRRRVSHDPGRNNFTFGHCHHVASRQSLILRKNE